MNQTGNLYDAIGGQKKIAEIVHAFYRRVAQHPDLIPIFPDDLTETIRKQQQFLSQFFGGPPIYSEEHGHPKLRYRHLPFEITPRRRDAWLACMAAALTEADVKEPYYQIIFDRLTLTAHHMINKPDDEKGESI